MLNSHLCRTIRASPALGSQDRKLLELPSSILPLKHHETPQNYIELHDGPDERQIERKATMHPLHLMWTLRCVQWVFLQSFHWTCHWGCEWASRQVKIRICPQGIQGIPQIGNVYVMSENYDPMMSFWGIDRFFKYMNNQFSGKPM